MAKQKKSMRHASAVKAHRQSVKRNLRNRQVKKDIRLAVRAVADASAAKDAAKLGQLMSVAAAAIDKASRRGTIHWKAAARKKSRLAKRINAQLAPAAAAKA
ncbi:MAG: 30S ribosomal protein S20 [Elusimicrobia bacterium]|nr:30S ribosomal protein S20 [Elusimicrobiota bacterium]MDE2426550.1 30S ribosomal protein S20 [Elusimicrobiota bacterium]